MLHASSNAIRRGLTSMDVDVVHAASVSVCMLKPSYILLST